MLSRASVPLIVIVCVLLVGGISIGVQSSFHQDQVAADADLERAARALMQSLQNRSPAADSPLTGADLAACVAHLRAEQHKPFADQTPLHWNEYEWRYLADRRLLIGRPRFYGRSFWLTVAVIDDGASQRLHFYVNDAGGRWGYDEATQALDADWHEILDEVKP